MGVYFGQWGEVALKRDTLQSALQTKLDPFDVNTSTKRFSVDHSSGSLITVSPGGELSSSRENCFK